MAEILFNKDGAPLIAYGKSYQATTTGAPADKLKKLSQPKDYWADFLEADGIKMSAWGQANNFPTLADSIIKSVGVLNTGLKFTRNFTLGQGIYACKVKDYDEQGNEILEKVTDKSLVTFANSRLVRKYMAKALRDYLKFGCAFVQIMMNADGSKIAGINTINAKYCRLSFADPKSGVITKCVVSGKWPDTPDPDHCTVYDVLDEYDPYGDLQRRRWGDHTKGKSFIYVIRDSWDNGEYYSSPIWWAAYLAGWVDMAKKIPSFLNKAYENQITWKWHIQIPYAFWDRQFPKTEFPDIESRKQAIESYMDSIEANLCGTDNADKPIFTFFEINPQNGRAEEQWIIKPLENKLSNEQNLVTSAAANSEIMFSIMVNPNVLGAGMPGGTYAGNQGGSNIREAYLVNIANCWLDRQDLLDPLEMYVRYNGSDEDIEWRFRNTILTTLDTGAGSKKTLS